MVKFVQGFLILMAVILITLILEGDEENLGDDYYYLTPYDALDVGYPGGAIVYKSDRKDFFQDIKVRGNVIKVKSDKDFIVAVRNNDTINFEIQNGKNTFSDKKKFYFIVIKSMGNVLGPFNKVEFKRKCNEIGVPNDLSLVD
jgi:hypothetical protein